MTPPTVKVRVKPKGNVPSEKQQERQAPPKQGKGLIHKIIEIVSNDIRHPERIFERGKKVNIPESKESWKDWEGQI